MRPRVADRLAQALGAGDQAAVAGRMAERVVDRLEVVEVDQHRRDAGAARRAPRAATARSGRGWPGRCGGRRARSGCSSLSSSALLGHVAHGEHDARRRRRSSSRSATRRSACTAWPSRWRSASSPAVGVRHPVGGSEEVGEPRPVHRVDELLDVAAAAARPADGRAALDRVGGERDRAALRRSPATESEACWTSARKRRLDSRSAARSPSARAASVRRRSAARRLRAKAKSRKPGDQQGQHARADGEPPRARVVALGRGLGRRRSRRRARGRCVTSSAPMCTSSSAAALAVAAAGRALGQLPGALQRARGARAARRTRRCGRRRR